MYLLDTNVVSELRKTHSTKINPNVLEWARNVDISSLYISVITVLELETGILLLQRRDEKQAAILRVWLDTHVLPNFSGKILSFDVNVAKECAKLHVPDRQAERDAIIAATALAHRMIVVTRNTQDFLSAGVKLLDPWKH